MTNAAAQFADARPAPDCPDGPPTLETSGTGIHVLTVLVNGLPGSGKTTLARELARELELPLFSKDDIKETLADILPGPDPGSERAWSNQLGQAAAETLWTLLGQAHGGAVLESPWLAHHRKFAAAGLTRAGFEVGVGGGAGVAARGLQEVWCEVPLALARQRYTDRAPQRHPVHLDLAPESEERWELWSRTAEPLGFGPVHRVDTSREVDVPLLAKRLRL